MIITISINRTFAHIADLILKLYVYIHFLIGAISLMTGKMVPVLAGAQEREKNLKIIFR
jgi:hypothetical protein